MSNTSPHIHNGENQIVRDYIRYHQLSGQFPQRQGLLVDGLRSALADPDTLCLPLGSSPNALPLPALVPMKHVFWHSPEYFDNRHDSQYFRGPTSHLSTFPGCEDTAWSAAISRAAPQLVESLSKGRLVVTDHAEELDKLATSRLLHLTSTVGLKAQEVALGPRKYAAVHTFVALVRFDRSGLVNLLPRGDTSLSGPIDDTHFADELWTIYEPPMRDLSRLSPAREYLLRAELGDFVSGRDVLQVCHREGGALACWMGLSPDLGHTPWLDCDYLTRVHPTVPRASHYVFPGVVTDENRRGNRFIERVVLRLAEELESRLDSCVVIFETGDTNAAFLPQLIEDAINATGIAQAHVAPVGRQFFRAWWLSAELPS